MEYYKKKNKYAVYKPGNSSCDFCLSGKLCMIKNANNPNNINKRNDVGNKCMHTVTFLLDETYFFILIYAPLNS